MAGKPCIQVAWISLAVAACSSGGSPGTPGAPSDGAGQDTGSSNPPATGDEPSNGGTITFQSIGKTGAFPSRRDPAIGPCDAYNADSCCLANQQITSDQLTPWDEDLILTLRGPMKVQQLAVYQPDSSDARTWSRVSMWDAAAPSAAAGLAFDGNGTDKTGFPGTVGTECLVNVSTDDVFACGPGSSPYCPVPGAGKTAHRGWSGSKLFVMLATMPHAGDVPGACSKNATGNWYDAPWIGLSVGELVRAGSFVSCQCYAKDPAKGYLADGCGQFNVFEVVNDNNSFKNLDVFSTDMIDYAGYVGEGPCGPACDASKLGPEVDLIDKVTYGEAKAGAVSDPDHGPRAALRRPESGYRYFVVLLDVATRTVQLALVHPSRVPAALGPLLPALPDQVDAAAVDSVRALRLPH